jgi:hypothetical protein
MAGRGRAPKPPETRRNHHAPERGEVTSRAEVGWQHGPIPAPPAKLLKVTRDVWDSWFRSWFAAHWEPEDLPGIYLVARLYDAVQRGQLQRMAELRLNMDAYGMTPKGQQDRRWKRPEPEEDAGAASATSGSRTSSRTSRYGHLRAVPEEPKAKRTRGKRGA